MRIDEPKLDLIKELYYERLLSVPEISKVVGASVWSTYYFFKAHNLMRRTWKEGQKIRFEKKEASFKKSILNTEELKELATIGTMLYWGEGYKGSEERPAGTLDFANSDPKMISLFIKFLRVIFHPDEKRLRLQIYCYADQDVNEIVGFWSDLTKIPRSQVTKPYVRQDFRKGGRKMKHGLAHIRYSDKKLVLEIKSMIDCYVQKYAPIG